MTFLSPGWLFALGALAVPVALHLWSRRGGTPIRVGSIQLLIGSPPAVRRAWRLQDPWLLLLRCAVLATLVLALAEPVRRPAARETRTWALVSGDLTGAGDSALIDSLTRAGLAVRRLDPGNLWTALRDADAAAPPGTRFVVFAPDLLRYFHGARPALRAPVEWRVRAPPPPPANVSGLNPREPRRVVIHADADRRDDARYVTAAVRAAAGASGVAAVVTNRLTDPADWIVWLSAQPVPEAVLDRVRAGATLVRDGGDDRGDQQARIVFVQLRSDRPAVRQSDGLVVRSPLPSTESAAPLWTDGAGRPLLTVARAGQGLVYRFGGRFHPAWSDLVLQPDFPLAFAALWASFDSRDDRSIAIRQLLPREAAGAMPAAAPVRSWFTALWLLALLLFAIERWLSR
jgi:aerotolerance regulator-like protein